MCEDCARERAAREAAEEKLSLYRHFDYGHPAMCCGQCREAIIAAESALAAEREAHAETKRDTGRIVEAYERERRGHDLTASRLAAALDALRGLIGYAEQLELLVYPKDEEGLDSVQMVLARAALAGGGR